MTNYTTINKRYTTLQQSFQEHAWNGTFVAVTKHVSIQDTQICIDLGIQHIAESKVQPALQKKKQLTGNFTYHMIGHLQTNKVKQAVACFDIIQSVDSKKLLTKINNEAVKIDKIMPILLQVNGTGETQKYGFQKKEIDAIILYAQELSHIDLQGCMCMGKAGDEETTKNAFLQLQNICNKHQLPICSMGMTQDWGLALACGSNMLRIGSGLFTYT